MKLPAAWGIVVAIVVPILALTVTMYVRRRVHDLRDAIERLDDIKVHLLLLDSRPLSQQHRRWLRRVDNLISKLLFLKINTALGCFMWCYFGKAGKDLKKVEELARQGSDLLQDARARAPAPVLELNQGKYLFFDKDQGKYLLQDAGARQRLAPVLDLSQEKYLPHEALQERLNYVRDTAQGRDLLQDAQPRQSLHPVRDVVQGRDLLQEDARSRQRRRPVRDFLQGREFLQDARPRQRHGVQPQHLQDLLPGMADYYEKVHSFIEAEGTQAQFLGIWGMQGVGKTTLLRLIRDSYTGHAWFDHILLVGVGAGCTVYNVQHAIAINLGLHGGMMSSLDELSRAKLIFNYLQHKTFLLLLDDIIEPLKWWAVRVPILSHKRQKIIFATRTRAACAPMGCPADSIIEMQCLRKDDAWKLFRDKVGLDIVDDHPQVRNLAEQMVSKCGGLPLALCALGRAMSSKTDPREWRSAYSQIMAMHFDPHTIDENVVALIQNLHWLL